MIAKFSKQKLKGAIEMLSLQMEPIYHDYQSFFGLACYDHSVTEFARPTGKVEKINKYKSLDIN
jgi:hypothetical protein